MHEQSKLQEAQHFYVELQRSLENRTRFKHNLSAFLTASRSVLQYVEREVKTKQGGKAWYDKRIAAKAILGYFKHKRDIEVHQEPVKPKLTLTIGVDGNIGLSGALSIIRRDKNGNILETYSSPESQIQAQQPSGEPTVSYRYSFKDWSGSEDIPTLALLYLQELESFVNEGVQKGYLTS